MFVLMREAVVAVVGEGEEEGEGEGGETAEEVWVFENNYSGVMTEGSIYESRFACIFSLSLPRRCAEW